MATALTSQSGVLKHIDGYMGTIISVSNPHTTAKLRANPSTVYCKEDSSTAVPYRWYMASSSVSLVRSQLVRRWVRWHQCKPTVSENSANCL